MTVDRFTWERWLLDDEQVTRMRWGVLAALATTYDQRDHTVHATQSQLASWTGHDISRVRAVLRWAQSAGLLTEMSRGRRLGNGKVIPSRYFLRLPQPVPDAPQEPTSQPVPHAPLQVISTGASRNLNRCPTHHPHIKTTSKTLINGLADPSYPYECQIADLNAAGINNPIGFAKAKDLATVRDAAKRGYLLLHDNDPYIHIDPTPYDHDPNPEGIEGWE